MERKEKQATPKTAQKVSRTPPTIRNTREVGVLLIGLGTWGTGFSDQSRDLKILYLHYYSILVARGLVDKWTIAVLIADRHRDTELVVQMKWLDTCRASIA